MFYSMIFNLFVVFVTINFDIVHLFLKLNLWMILVLLSMFDELTCLVYYIGYWVSLSLGYSANEGICLNLV